MTAGGGGGGGGDGCSISSGGGAGGGGGGGGGSSLGGRFFSSVKAAALEGLKEAQGALDGDDGDDDDDDDSGDDDDDNEGDEEEGDADDDSETKGEGDGGDNEVKNARQAKGGGPRRRRAPVGSGQQGRIQASKNGLKGAPKLTLLRKAAAAAAAAAGGALAAAMEPPQTVVYGKHPWLPSGLTPHQVELRARARELVLEHVLPYAAKWDEQRTLPRRLFAAAGRAGFCAQVAPLLSGGRGWSASDAVAVFEVLGAADLNSAALLAHQNAVTWMVGKSAGPMHKLPLTAALGSGLALGSCAASEPQQEGPHQVDRTACFAVKYKDMRRGARPACYRLAVLL
ncbi:hypothetical protein PLESTM_001320300 [Pleodorina starrii]|nr:hypothetical protein PLESTM_001320300 [Pleodorina starrii]